jgi:hypothetical protein
MTLFASVDGVTVYASFSITVEDACQTTNLQSPLTTLPLTNMAVTRNLDPVQTQNFVLTSNIETSYSLMCNYVFTLISPPAYVSLSGTTISVDPALTTDADVGTQTI